MAASIYPTSSATYAGAERLWKIWWMWGILVGWTTSGMIFFAEFIRKHPDHWFNSYDYFAAAAKLD